MTDLSEPPAVPPEDSGGDERAGLLLAGGLLLLVGIGGGLLWNAYVHLTASPGGSPFLWWVITPTFGPYAQATALLGLVAGIVGALLLWLSRRTAGGPFRLPGTAY